MQYIDVQQKSGNDLGFINILFFWQNVAIQQVHLSVKSAWF